MYCPRCSQQASLETNFCPRCGFQFAALKELIRTGGTIPISPVQSPGETIDRSPRQKGIRFGAKLVFFSAVILPLFFALAFPADSPAPLLVPLSLFLAGAAWMLYARLFLDSGSRSNYPPYVQLPTWNAQTNPAIPPAQDYSVPAPVRWQANTGEIVPTSVTERTTNLLDHE